MNYADHIRIRLKNDTLIHLKEWQDIYQLPIESTKIGHHFSYMEPRFVKDIEQFNALIVDEYLIKFMDAYREEKGTYVNVNSFNRTNEYQNELRKRGFKTAKYSPHVQCMAVDIDTQNKLDTIEQVKIMERVSKKTGIRIRIGYKSYIEKGQSFIHVDVCPMYFDTGCILHESVHPIQWERELRW